MRLALLVLVGCSKGYSGPPPSGDGAAVFGRVSGLLGGGLGNVRVCAMDVDVPCVMTSGDGEFLLDHLPEESNVVVTMDHDNHLPTAYHHHTSVDQEWEKTLIPNTLVNSMLNRADTVEKPGRGHAMFIAWDGPDYSFDRVEGVRMQVVGGGGELYYQGNGGMPDLDLNATSKTGSGGAFNLQPGDYELVFSGSGLVCEHWFGFAFEPGEPVPITVFEGYGSYVDLVCR